MATSKIDERRTKRLNDAEVADGDYTLYWMQQSQRSQSNHALEFAVQRANVNGTSLIVAFGLTGDSPDANLRHFKFMLEGLQQVETALARRSIQFVVRQGDPASVCLKLAKAACEVICDRGYLRHQRTWRDKIAPHSKCRVWQIESDAIVPVETASDKQEYAARTIRKQLNDAAGEFFEELSTTSVDNNSMNLDVSGVDLSDIDDLLRKMSIDRSVNPAADFPGGTSQAKARLKRFLDNGLGDYDDRTSVLAPNVSYLSPYLHFGQISPIEIAQAVNSKRGYRSEAKESFLDELIVRRELAINFVHYCDDYDSLKCLPDWAATTLGEHENDSREHHYTFTELEAAQTHDIAWNAAMMEMKHRGYLHNHLRMYWGKKIIEWTNTYDHAYRTILELNNRYFLDGRDPNSYSNVAWLFGLHDRAHQEREIFGKVRYMSADGLRRKIDVDGYIKSVEEKYDVDLTGKSPGKRESEDNA